MKTSSILDKYKLIISSLLDCHRDQINFEVLNDNIWIEIGSLVYPDKKDSGRWDWCLGHYRVMFDEEGIASFELYQLPHCCGIVVSCRAFVDSKFRNKRVGTMMNSLRQDIGRAMGYSLMLCTDIDTNTHQRQLLKTQGWEDLHSFINRRTKNKVIISVINI